MRVGRKIILPVIVIGALLILPATMAQINTSPNCDLDGPYVGTVGSPIVFDGSGSYDPDGDPLTYQWDFNGDLSIDYTESPSSAPDGTYDGITTHSYTQPSVFQVRLTVQDDRGGICIFNTVATITDTIPVPEFPFGLTLITSIAFTALLLFRRRHSPTINVV